MTYAKHSHLIVPCIELSSYDLGDVTEADYDAWVEYVADHIDLDCGFEVEVIARRFGATGSDRITNATDEQRTTITEAVAAMWERAEWGSASAALCGRCGLPLTEGACGSETCQTGPVDPTTYIAVADQHVGTCEALRWAALSVRPFVLASGTDEDDVRERAIAAVGHDAVTLHAVGT